MAHSSSPSIRTLIHAAWEATQGERFRFFAFVFLFIIAYSLDLLVPWTIGYTLGIFVQHGFTEEAYQLSLYGISAYVALRFTHTFFHHYARYLQNTVAYGARMETMTRLFEAFVNFPLSWHVNHHSGENLSKLHRSVGAIDNTIGTYVWQVVEGTVKVAFASVAIFALDFWVAVNVIGMGLITILVMILFNRGLIKTIRKNNAFYDKVNRICVDYLFNIVTVKTLKLEDPAKKYLRALRAEGLTLSKAISRFTELKWSAVGIGYAIVLGSSLVIYFHGHTGLKVAFDVAQVYVLLSYLDKIFQAIGSFTGYYGGIMDSATAYEDAQRTFDEEKVFRVPQCSFLSSRTSWSSILIKNLDFSYGSEGQTGLKNISFTMQHGDKIALVGPSGGGKSTLLKVLAGILTSDGATLLREGKEPISLEEISGISLLLPQEPEIFSETVRYNLSMGEQVEERDLHFAISLCRLEGVIAKLPQGWESNLAEKGLNLSVGEKQRVAMARGLLRIKDKQILLLDEPTSSLDPMTEKAIFLDLFSRFSDRTILTACHRLALVPLFNKIIFIRNGRVEEMGEFSELLQRQGSFYYAWEDYQRGVLSEAKEL